MFKACIESSPYGWYGGVEICRGPGAVHMEEFTVPNWVWAEMDKLLESSKSSSLNLPALSSKLGLVQNEIQA